MLRDPHDTHKMCPSDFQAAEEAAFGSSLTKKWQSFYSNRSKLTAATDSPTCYATAAEMSFLLITCNKRNVFIKKQHLLIRVCSPPPHGHIRAASHLLTSAFPSALGVFLEG